MSNPGMPNTIFSGTTGPAGDPVGPNQLAARAAMYVFLFLLFPPVLIVYFVWLALYQWGRMPYWIPLLTGGGLFVVGGIFGGISERPIRFMLEGYAQLLSEDSWWNHIVSHLPRIIVGQLWPALFLGTVAAGLSSWWKWIRRPKYREMFIHPGPFLKARVRKTTKEIGSGINCPESGITLGVALDPRDGRFAGGSPGEVYGRRVVMSEQELSAHCLVTGGSGTGKTQTMLAGIRDAIRQGRGVVYVDLKGSPDVADKIADLAFRYDREFYHWTIHDPARPYNGPSPDGPAFYDPISRGDASRRKDLLIGAMRWDVEYYKSVISDYVQTVFRVIDLVPPLDGVDTLSDVADLMSPEALLYRARYINAAKQPELAALLARIPDMEATERSGIRNMAARLNTVIASTAGQWLRKDPEGIREVDLFTAAHTGQVVVFSLDTARYEETASLLAGLIIQDVKTLSSELLNAPLSKPLALYIDEFSAIDTTNLLGLFARARESKISCTLATQVLADLARREPTFVDQVLGIISSFIIHRANTEGDARIFAGLSGIDKKVIARRNVQESMGAFGVMGEASSTGVSFLEERDEYRVGVGTFQKLETGQAIYIAKSPEMRIVNYVKVILEDPTVPEHLRDKALPLEINSNAHKEQEAAREVYPHPLRVELAKSEATTAPDILTRSAEAAPIEGIVVPSRRPVMPPNRPTRPGAKTPDADPSADPSTAPITAGRPAGAPMPILRPDTPPASRGNDFKPDEWSGIP